MLAVTTTKRTTWLIGLSFKIIWRSGEIEHKRKWKILSQVSKCSLKWILKILRNQRKNLLHSRNSLICRSKISHILRMLKSCNSLTRTALTYQWVSKRQTVLSRTQSSNINTKLSQVRISSKLALLSISTYPSLTMSKTKRAMTLAQRSSRQIRIMKRP